MKSKRLTQILVVLVLMFSTMGSSQPALASTNSSTQGDAVVINRNLNYWDATYIGFTNSSIYEKWHFDFTQTENFTVTVSPISGDLVPLLILLDANGNELARGVGTLTSIQPAGEYAIQVQPESGGGFYVLKLRQVVITEPSVSTTVNPSSVNVGESALVTVSLNNVPTEGYTSAEFTCTYDATLAEASNIAVNGLFGADAAVAINGPQNGTFIVAIAGSNGNKATTSGTVFTFNITGLQAGQTAIECKARVSKGDNILVDISSVSTSLTILGSAPTPTFTPTPIGSIEPTFTPTPYGSPVPTFTSTPDGAPTSTPVGSPVPTFTSTPIVTSTPVFTPTPIESPTPTPLPNGSVSGTVIAGKPVSVGLYSANGSLVTSVTANADGLFLLTAPSGTYTLVAVSSGFLGTQGSVTLIGGSTITQPSVTLLAGDIDNNNVIDQFDALTIGMSYNTSTPSAADLNNDGVINVLDLELLARNYHKTGPIAWQ